MLAVRDVQPYQVLVRTDRAATRLRDLRASEKPILNHRGHGGHGGCTTLAVRDVQPYQVLV